MGASAIGAIPIAGDIVKPIIKAEKEAITEGIETALKTEGKEAAEKLAKEETERALREASKEVPQSTVWAGKLEIEAGRTLSPEEQRIANKLVAEGKDVKAPKEFNQQHVKNPDFQVDGVKTELKTVTDLKGTNAHKLSKGLSGRILDGGGQAPHVILDVTGQPGMTKDIAEQAIKRAYGRLGQLGSDKVKTVRVIGQNFDVIMFIYQIEAIN